jgi:hypothetical protein
MGFIFGLIVGGIVFGSDGTAPSILGNIPLRCLHAFGVSDAEYRDCRAPSLNFELYNQNCPQHERAKSSGPCSLDRHIAWEIAGLRELKAAGEKSK